MITTMAIIIVLLLITIAMLIIHIKAKNKALVYMSKKLPEIIEKKSNEKLLINTGDTGIRDALIQINNLLDYNQKLSAEYHRTQLAMKKMLSNISHDLKTPLTVIVGYAEMICTREDLTEEEYTTLNGRILNKSKELLNTINEFFRLAKLESGDTQLKLSRVEINEICRTGLLEYFEILSEKNIDVVANIPEEKYWVLGNEDAIKRILDNLITNAIRYGYEGKILGLDVSSRDDIVRIEVWDKGKGINDTEKKMVFERLYTLEDSRNKDYQGSGIGLAITKKLVELMNGTIILESISYKRTSFIIELNRITY